MEEIATRSLKFCAPPSQNSAQNDQKTHRVIRIAEKCLIPVDDTLVQKLGIKDGDTVYQDVDDKGSIRLVFTKRTPVQ